MKFRRSVAALLVLAMQGAAWAIPQTQPTLTQLRAARIVLEAQLHLLDDRKMYQEANPRIREPREKIRMYGRLATPQAQAVASRDMLPPLESRKADLEIALLPLSRTHTEASPAIHEKRVEIAALDTQIRFLKTKMHPEATAKVARSKHRPQ